MSTVVSGIAEGAAQDLPRAVDAQHALAQTQVARADTQLPVAVAPVLQVSQLRKMFGSQRVVSDVSFEVAPGEVFALLGQNGAGKTTTIKMCCGLLSPDQGTVRINGYNPQSGAGAATQLGALLEGNRNLYWRMTPMENLRYFGVLKGMTVAGAVAQGSELLARFGLADKAHQQVQTLSRGMMQRLAIAVSMLSNPKVLFLDEPTLGLDVGSVAQMVDMIRALSASGVAIILTTHQLDIAEALSHRVAIMHQGEVIRIAQTEDLKREFSSAGYEIRLQHTVGDELRLHIEDALGGAVDGCDIRVPDEADLYAALEAIRPAPVERVRRCRSDLTTIFLRLTGGQGHV
ncbi:ABC transporter ATP-binding protein [Stenotrophomonas maltophilia]|nr:ABC transporter ATP-binding protein [Stenotrophomonas maltophilia]MBN5133916.1 ABC transporter ATP-binding protein [Stenotrophomonas maltophilia]